MDDFNGLGKKSLSLTDAHAHLGTEAERQQRLVQGIKTLICAGNAKEAARLCELQKNLSVSQVLIPTYGLHPWHAGWENLNAMKPFLELSEIVGEIGMDSVWCDVPLSRQREIFEYQLEFASKNKKPVILHTKGQEKEIADCILRYPNRYLVHWYSSEKYLEEYLALDCYFSIGPDVFWNPAVKRLAKMVDYDRLLIETDGLNAVGWAYGEAANNKVSNCPPVPAAVQESLSNTLKTVAGIRKAGTELLASQIEDNFYRFCGAYGN